MRRVIVPAVCSLVVTFLACSPSAPELTDAGGVGSPPGDAGSTPTDAGDAPHDAGSPDAGGSDAGRPDAGWSDAGRAEAGADDDAGLDPEAPDAGGDAGPEPEPTWACGEFSCAAVDVTTTVGAMQALDQCQFELALQAPLSEGEALADALLDRLEDDALGERRTLDQVLDALNRVARPGLSAETLTRMNGLSPVGFRWNTGDDAVDYWYPQGLTGSSDASSDGLVEGRRLVMASWYHKSDVQPPKGVRLSVADVSDLTDIHYRHLLLVDPIATPEGPSFMAAEYDSGGSLHAGGIVWYGDYLYVADTVQGLRVYDLSRMFRPTHYDDGDRVGVSADRSDAMGYGFAVPRIGRYRLTTGSCRVRFAFIGLDRAATPPALVTGEYFSDHPSGKMAVWPLDGAAHLLESRQGTTRASAAVVIGQTRSQGGVRVGAHYYVSSSSQDGSDGRLYKNRPGQISTSVNWVYGAEDLYYERGTNLIWTVAEHPGRRDVIGIPLP